MSDLALFTIAVLTILATPGPTNALLTTSGALVGFRRSLPLISAELAGYGVSISILLLASRPLIAAFPPFEWVLRATLIAYLLWLAWHLWHSGVALGDANVRVVTWWRVFVTTLLNPKGAVFAFAIFPPFEGAEDVARYSGIFAVTTMTVASAWMAFGASLGRFALRGRRIQLPRVTAVVLVVFACIVAVTAIAGRGG